MPIGFVGRRGAVFWLALKTGFWSILTLGFYRFWMKTRLRRYFWSSIRPGGHPMEYVGDPWEKLLGFFIAVVILTFYIGVVNLILMFISFSVFDGNVAGYFLSFLGVIPLWFYARYRAWRYVLGRTRWRGVRFGLEPGAWGYAWRACVHWLITVCSAGILWPRMTFYLEKYRTDRTFFGSAKLMQGGHWTMLYRPMVPLFLAVVACGLWTLWVMVLQPIGPFFDLFLRGFVAGATGLEIDVEGLEDGPSQAIWRLWLLLPLVLAVYVGVVHYIFGARRMMANHKSAPGVTFASKLRTGRVAWIYAGGTILAYLVLVLGLLLLLIILVPVIGLNVLNNVGGIDAGVIGTAPRWLTITASVILYFGVFLMWSVVYNTFVTFPLMRHMAGTLSLPTHDGLQDVSQVARDEFAEAEGFAEALDLGAAI
ncbi:membrane protein [Tateyamaria sp. ANG-S1]|nr:membrane protein [Tateyamaria sp. ANG-S1]